MYPWSLVSLAVGAFFSGLTVRLIKGYWAPGYIRPVSINDDGEESLGLVVNDWWVGTSMLAAIGLIIGVWILVEWAREEWTR
jgi:hypothetical protein